MRTMRPATALDMDRVRDALAKLCQARDLLAAADCPRAAAAVRRALKSAEGAERHMEHRARPAIEARARQGCWHYDFQRFCTQCDPASYEPSEESEEE